MTMRMSKIVVVVLLAAPVLSSSVRIRSACRAVVTLLLVLVPLIGLGKQAGPIAPPLAITHVTVIDTHTGAIQPDMTVLIREGRIASVGPAPAPVPGDADQFDGRGTFAIPDSGTCTCI
jgi:hypothetical protein